MEGDKIKFLTLNCNSLNLGSPAAGRFYAKAKTIESLRAEVIFLQDLRINASKKPANLQLVKDTFAGKRYGEYESFINSTMNHRGVAILVKKSVEFEYIEHISDSGENFIILVGKLHKFGIVMVSFYGPNKPNKNALQDFAKTLKTSRAKYPNFGIIIAGDHNFVIDQGEKGNNLGATGGKTLPNVSNSEIYLNLMNDLKLLDPLRLEFPNSRIFTFARKDVNATSQNRLDFFYYGPNCIKLGGGGVFK